VRATDKLEERVGAERVDVPLGLGVYSGAEVPSVSHHLPLDQLACPEGSVGSSSSERLLPTKTVVVTVTMSYVVTRARSLGGEVVSEAS